MGRIFCYGLCRQAVVALVVTCSFAATSPPHAAAQSNRLDDLLGDGLATSPQKPPKAQFEARLSTETVHPGETVKLAITARLPKSFYIYGTEGNFGGRTRITFDAQGAVAEESLTADQPGKSMFDPGLDAHITKFYDTVTWTQSFRVIDNASTVSIRGKLEGQYCNGSDEGGLCVQILPAYRFDLTSQVVGNGSTTPSPEALAAVEYDTNFRPSRGQAPDPIAFRVRLDPPTAKDGDTATLFITAKLDEGWHTYSLTQTGIGAEPTVIDLSRLHHLQPLGKGLEADRPYVQEQPTDEVTLQSYYGEVTWSQQFLVTASEPGDYGVGGEITYAVCDETSCKPLKSVSFKVGRLSAVANEAAEEPLSPFAMGGADEVASEQPAADGDHTAALEGQRAAALTLAALEGRTEEAVSQDPEDTGLLAFLVLCIGGGFLALLTPCSFPMVPITVSFFLKQSEANHKRPWLLALVYCGSIVLAFTVLGVGIAALFGATQLNQLANNPWVNIAIGAVFVAFAFNMLGAFEIRMPTSLLTWSSMHEGGGSYLGAVFMALTFTLTSFTCTFAVAGTLLVSASQGNVYWPVIGMLAFGSAFASPFLVLALLPGLLKKLPKSGGWMNSVKVVMGLVELGAAIKFFSIADLAWNPTPVFFTYVTCLLIWTVISLAIAGYLFGWYRFSHDTPTESLSIARGMLAMSFTGFALMLAFLTIQPDRAEGLIMDQVVAFAPPHLDATETDLGPTIEHHGMQFALDLQKAKSVATQKQRPLLLDFTGVNCVNCRRMEKKMERPENLERIQQFVAVQLYADKVPAITNPDLAESILARNLDLQENWFGDVALPSYAVVSPDGKTILAAYIGYERKEGEFTRFLDYGWDKWQQLQAQKGRDRRVNVANR